MEEMVLQLIVLLLGAAIFVIAAYSDIRTRRIPNELIAALFVLAAIRIALDGNPTSAIYTLEATTTLFVATFLLFWRGLLGGGDVKLMVAAGFLIGYHDVLGYLVVMSVSGGLIAMAILAGDKLKLRRAESAPEQQEAEARLSVPYGVAISAAAILTLLAQSFARG